MLRNLIASACFSLTAACASATPDSGQTAPITFDAGGRPSATVRLNDARDFLFAIDTAAQTTVIGQGVVDALGLEPDPHRQAQMHGSSGVVMVPMFAIPRIEFAGRVVEDGYYARPAAAHGENIGHDGILGQDVFAGGTLRLDFAAGRVTLDGPLPGSEGMPVERMFGNFILAEVMIDGVAATAVIDTGAAMSFANPALMAALGVLSDELDTRTSNQGVSQDEMETVEGYRGRITLAGETVDGPLAFSDAPIFSMFGLTGRPALILGMDALGQLGAITIDYETSRFWAEGR